MTFLEKLKAFNNLHIDIADLMIANAMSFWEPEYEIELTEQEFESYCQLALDSYLKADDIKVDSIAKAILQLKENGKNPLKYSRRAIIDMAYDYEC